MHRAHIHPDSKKEQTLAEHCINVSRLCESFGAKIGLGETAGLTGLLHDAGKGKDEYETYLRYSIEHPEDHSKKGTVNHSAAGAKYIFDNFWGGDIFQRFSAQMTALSVCSHHGGISDVISLEGIDEFDEKIHPEKDIAFDECIRNFTREVIELPQIAERFYKSKDEIIEIINKMKEANIFDAFSLHLLVKFLFSCLIDSDRLDTSNFMEDKINEGASSQNEVHAGKEQLWKELSDQLEKAIGEFPKGRKVELLRGEISDACKSFAGSAPGIYQLCVPTGGGKTLSSLRYALEHAGQYNKDRIFYIIPFTTIIDQNAKVIKDILKRDDVILEHHSNLIKDNKHEDYKLLTERWSSPIILTTMVQFLNTLFSGGTQDIRRMHNLANSVIILDEIQSVPVKCIHMLNGALNFLSKLCNATIILCTATQPLLSETEKPLLLSTPTDIIENIQDKFRQFRRVDVKNKCINGGYDITELTGFVLEKMEVVKSTLVIFNTRKSVRELFNQLKRTNDILPKEERFHIYHLSTYMCPKHRMEVLDNIKAKLGTEKVICVSSQLIEAGVDVSFECVVRAVAGLDSIAQAAGRCNRHGEKSCADVYIVNVKDEGLSMLPDIKEGQICTDRVLDEFRDNPDSFDGDLLSPQAIKRYFEYYFHEIKEKMDYGIKQENADLYDLLSANNKGIKAYIDRPGQKILYPVMQAFKTAGEHFQVIDENTTGVIVPYGEGEKLIAEINGNCSLEELRGYIKEAQQYSVNLFENDLKKIGNGIYPLKNGGILALREEFYDDDLGVVTEGKPMKTLIH